MDFFKKSKTPIVLALGFFDGAHLGHREVFSVAKSMCKKEKFAVFTFGGKLFKNASGNIYTLKEKKLIFKSLGANYVMVAKWDSNLYNMSPQHFLLNLVQNHNVKGIVCGTDFTFGKNAEGNVAFLKEFCTQHDIIFREVNLKTHNNRQISTTLIKEYLINGKIKEANYLLGDNYFVLGKVLHGRGDGSKSVFPTANVVISKEKLKIKSGVYATRLKVDGKYYNALTNYGTCPTFNFKNFIIESHVLDFSNDIYNKDIKIEFLDYLRDIKKFNSAEELKNQIKKDMEYFL